jgi:hypothetical protein
MWYLEGCVMSRVSNEDCRVSELLVKLTLEQVTKAQTGSRCIALYARWGWVVNAKPGPLYPWERRGTHCLGGWVGLRAGLDGCGKSAPPPTGLRSPDRPANCDSPELLVWADIHCVPHRERGPCSLQRPVV